MQSYVYVILLATVTFIGCSQNTDLSEMSKESLSGGPYQATGFKVGGNKHRGNYMGSNDPRCSPSERRIADARVFIS